MKAGKRPFTLALIASCAFVACEPTGQSNVGTGDPTGERSARVDNGGAGSGAASAMPTSTSAAIPQDIGDAGLHFCDPANPSSGCFDRLAMQTALNWARGQVDTCAIQGGPSGDGHIGLVLESSGAPSSETLDLPPFMNSVIAPCIQNVFAAIRVPPFSGGPMNMGASFHVDTVGGFDGGARIP